MVLDGLGLGQLKGWRSIVLVDVLDGLEQVRKFIIQVPAQATPPGTSGCVVVQGIRASRTWKFEQRLFFRQSIQSLGFYLATE